MLNGESQGPLNHVFVPTNAAPSLAPEGKSLISVSVVGKADSEWSLPEVRNHMQDWFGNDVTNWRELRIYYLPEALPEQEPSFYSQRLPTDLPKGMFVCGDHTETTSLNGALKSGRETASQLTRYLHSKSSLRE
jgi:hypothetical protein